MLTEPPKANCAKCVNTPHSSNPTLSTAVTGLLGIIQNRGTSVLRECPGVTGDSGPTDGSVQPMHVSGWAAWLLRARGRGVAMPRYIFSGGKITVEEGVYTPFKKLDRQQTSRGVLLVARASTSNTTEQPDIERQGASR